MRNGRNFAGMGLRCAIWLGILLFAPATPPTFAQRVQIGSESCSWTTKCSATFSKGVAFGDSVAVAVKVSDWETGAQTPAVTDSQGSSYALVKSATNTAALYQIFVFCATAASAGATSVSSTIPVKNSQDVAAAEFQGSCAVDQSTAATGASTAAATSSVSVQTGDFLFGVGASKYGETFHPGTGFTLGNALSDLVTADSLESAAANASLTFNLSGSTNWTAILVAFSPASSSGYSITATVRWDDGTAVAGTVSISQETSTNPLSLNSLGSFPLVNGVATGTLNPNLALPLTFFVSLVDTTGTVVNSLTLFSSPQLLQGISHNINASIVLSKANATVESVSF